MSISRALLTRGPAYIAYNSANFFTDADISIREDASWDRIMTSMFGRVDAAKKDLVIKINAKLWGAYENLSTIFPAALLAPNCGASLFGTSDVPLVIQAKNNDKITYVNAQITKVANLQLSAEASVFSADVEWTCLIANSTNPETASAFTTRATNAYSDATAAFAKTNYVRTRYVAAWGAITGFTSFIAQRGWAIDWEHDLKAIPVDGFGTMDYTVVDTIARAKCIPIGPTLAQLKTNSQQEAAYGVLGSVISGDLVLTGANSGPVITLKNAFMAAQGVVFGQEPLRNGETTWETTRGFTAGAPAIVASAA